MSPQNASVLVQFNRLIEELLSGSIQRGGFQPWEIEILLDIESCDLTYRSSKAPSNATLLGTCKKVD